VKSKLKNVRIAQWVLDEPDAKARIEDPNARPRRFWQDSTTPKPIPLSPTPLDLTEPNKKISGSEPSTTKQDQANQRAEPGKVRLQQDITNNLGFIREQKLPQHLEKLL
jgi:hypothetical protein